MELLQEEIDTVVKEYKVFVCCVTYNQSKFIKDALNGFAIQRTTFPYVCAIIDDASSDGEPDVILDWIGTTCTINYSSFAEDQSASIIVAQHNSNNNCTVVAFLLKHNLNNEPHKKLQLVSPWLNRSQYIAFCDGDDFFSDPDKLQIQSNCLDSHPELDICAHGKTLLNNVSGDIRHISFLNRNCIIPVEKVILFDGDIVATSSIFCRTNLLQTSDKFLQHLLIDYSICIKGAIRGGIYYLNLMLSITRTNVPYSFCTTMENNMEFRKKYVNKKTEMLDIFDKEYDFKYHEYVAARHLLDLIVFTNNRGQNIQILKTNREGLIRLSPIQLSAIICKCYCPTVGRFFIKFFNKLGIYPRYW